MITGTTPQTSKQKREIRRIVLGALDSLLLDKDASQRLLGRGGELQARIKQTGVELSAPIEPKPQPKPTNLLEHIATVDIPEITDPFVVNDHIRDEQTVGGVKWWLGSNFLRHFSGTTLPACSAGTLNIHKLAKASVDTPVIAELGGESVAETSLAQLYWMIMQQPSGEQGNLLTNGYANIFYIRDAKGTLWAVSAGWNSDDRCWRVEAYSVTNPLTWGAGSQVVSR